MNKPNFLRDLSKSLCEALPDNLHTLKNDLAKNFHSVLQNAFNKLDIVNREEFDAQTKVLARSRQRIEKLEAEVRELESLLKEKNHD